LPDESLVALAVAAPLRFRVTPVPADDGVIVPEMLKVLPPEVAVKVGTVTFPPLTVTDALVGWNVKPVLVGVTV
jgi:hypothetical protein